LGECLVSWLRKKQSSISLSTTEAEYIATTTCCTQVLWMKQTLKDIQVEYDEPILIFCDNTNAISISKNPVMHSKMKHIPDQVSLSTGTGCREEHQGRVYWDKREDCRYLHQTSSEGDL
jgi:hypothetical protein